MAYFRWQLPLSRQSAKRLVLSILLIITASLAWINRIDILNLPMSLLVRDDQPAKGADFILVMMGNVSDRTPHAARLYLEGYADKIIFAEAEEGRDHRNGFRMKDGQATKTYLSRLGVPDSGMVFLSDSRNTSSGEEVKLVLDHIKRVNPSAKRVILVTSWYHSSRATWIAERMNESDLRLESSPSPSPEFWWHKEWDFLAVFNEYLKWVYYLIRY